MERATRYVMLITSLPYHGPLFGAHQTPLSRLRLSYRLKILDETDIQALRDLSSVLEWIHQSMSVTDAELIARAKRFEETWGTGFAYDIMRFRMELRTLYTALRRRRRGETKPPAGQPWGYGRWVRHIEHYWNEPGFRLQQVYPWINEAERLVETRDSLGLERLLLGFVWGYLTRISVGHEFDFEAVVIYVMRWDLIARWSSYDGARAVQRFDSLVDTGLGRYGHLFDEMETHSTT
ncbi:MAG: hypothetical protein PVF13_01065 [Chromatiales bacterium]|jgi:hypothetical protein